MSAPNQSAVLLVEDEAIIRMVVSEHLREAGLEVIEAGSAEEALDALDDHPEVSLLFTDLNMPGDIDGLELARRVHRLRPTVEILVTSGRERLQNADLPDDGDFIEKPYSPAEVTQLVAKKLLGDRA
jgi:CheY-like chemotaxis protein